MNFLVQQETPPMFLFPLTNISPCIGRIVCDWMHKAPDSLLPLMMGTHARLGEASILLELAGQPKLLNIIAEMLV